MEELRQRVAVARKPYHDEVGRILRLAALPRRRRWRVVFRPSFHAECAVEVFDDLRVVARPPVTFGHGFHYRLDNVFMAARPRPPR